MSRAYDCIFSGQKIHFYVTKWELWGLGDFRAEWIRCFFFFWRMEQE